MKRTYNKNSNLTLREKWQRGKDIYIYIYIKRAAVAVTKHQNGGVVTCNLWAMQGNVRERGQGVNTLQHGRPTQTLSNTIPNMSRN